MTLAEKIEGARGSIPTKEGYFWAKWRIKAEGTADEDEPANGDWEIVQVVENCQDEKDPEHLMVMVLGVGKWQSLENFVWGKAALPDKPMTEDEIKQIIGRSMGAALMTGVNAVDEVFRVLKAENVLFVKEEKS